MPELGIVAAGLVDFVLALMAILVLFALWVPFAILGALLAPVPVVGSWIQANITSGLQTAMQKQRKNLDNAASVLRHFFWAIVAPIPWIFSKLIDGLDNAKQTANTAHDHATAAQTNAENYAQTKIEIIQEDYLRKISEAEAAANDMWSQVLSKEVDDTIHLQAEINNLQIEIGNLAGAAPGVTAQELTALQDEVQSQIAQDLATAEAYTNGQVGTVQGEITGLQGVVQGIPAEIVGTIDQLVPGLITGALTGAGVAAIPGLIAQVQALEAEATTCLEPLCDTVTPNAKQLGNLGNLLKGIENLAIDAFFIALAAEAVVDPGTVIHDLEDVIDPIGGAVLAGYRDLIGI